MNPPASSLPRLALYWVFRLSLAGLVGILGAAALLYFVQDSLIYHPRPYREVHRRLLAPGTIELRFSTRAGRQAAFYLPDEARSALPERFWVAFCGNGSLALDWMPLARGVPSRHDAFLLIDYPGYGDSEGRASTAATEAAADGALAALAARLHISESQLESRLNVIGHSLGAAAALNFAPRTIPCDASFGSRRSRP